MEIDRERFQLAQFFKRNVLAVIPEKYGSLCDFSLVDPGTKCTCFFLSVGSALLGLAVFLAGSYNVIKRCTRVSLGLSYEPNNLSCQRLSAEVLGKAVHVPAWVMCLLHQAHFELDFCNHHHQQRY
jgi:hypothetical protein